MKIEFIILADSAQALEGKLYMLGGGWNLHRSGAYPSPIRFTVALGILVPFEETQITHPVSLTIADEARIPIVPILTAQFIAGKVLHDPKKGDATGAARRQFRLCAAPAGQI